MLGRSKTEGDLGVLWRYSSFMGSGREASIMSADKNKEVELPSFNSGGAGPSYSSTSSEMILPDSVSEIFVFLTTVLVGVTSLLGIFGQCLMKSM